MYIKIDFDSDVPIYNQLRNQIVEGIALGQLKEGEELPSVRQMAEDIGINMHTVNKAYALLKNEGFIKLDRRKGAVISLSTEETKENTINKLKEELKIITAEAHCKGIGEEEVAKMISEIYTGYEKFRNK